MTSSPTHAAERVRLLVLAGVWPQLRENTEAANVVLHETLVNLLATGSFDIAFARIASDPGVPTPAAAASLRELEGLGLSVLPGIRLHERRKSSFVTKLGQTLTSNPAAFLDGANNVAEVRALVEDWRADCVLTVWCEHATNALYGVPVRRMAYHGNPEHKTARARLDFEWENRPPGFDARLFTSTVRARLLMPLLKRAHLRVMRTFDAVGDVSANDASFYARHGVRAFYLRNMWPHAATTQWHEIRDRVEQTVPIKIVGNVGGLAATGNTRGLHTLGTAVLPALKRVLGEGNFEVHVFGGRQLHRYLVPILNDPHIRIRGFVDDLDAEMLSSPVFLVTNNHTDFKVGNTRFLHAWSLGSCVVTFKGSAEGMPEIVHRRNALLASTPDEMAELIAEAARDQQLRRSLGHAGAQAVETLFNPTVVTKVIADRLLAISGRRAPDAASV